VPGLVVVRAGGRRHAVGRHRPRGRRVVVPALVAWSSDVATVRRVVAHGVVVGGDDRRIDHECRGRVVGLVVVVDRGVVVVATENTETGARVVVDLRGSVVVVVGRVLTVTPVAPADVLAGGRPRRAPDGFEVQTSGRR